MKEKALTEKENSFRNSDNFLKMLKYFIDNGDSPMKVSRLRKQSRESNNLKIYFNKNKTRGEN